MCTVIAQNYYILLFYLGPILFKGQLKSQVPIKLYDLVDVTAKGRTDHLQVLLHTFILVGSHYFINLKR